MTKTIGACDQELGFRGVFVHSQNSIAPPHFHLQIREPSLDPMLNLFFKTIFSSLRYRQSLVLENIALRPNKPNHQAPTDELVNRLPGRPLIEQTIDLSHQIQRQGNKRKNHCFLLGNGRLGLKAGWRQTAESDRNRSFFF